MLGLGLLAFVALIFLAARKVRKYRVDGRFEEFKNGDVDDTDVDDASLASSPRKTRAYVVGEEGSVRTFATCTRFPFIFVYYVFRIEISCLEYD